MNCFRQIDGLAPTFSKKPAIRQEDDGKRLLFECRIQADPTPSVVWSHGGGVVKDDARHKVSCQYKYRYCSFILIKSSYFKYGRVYELVVPNCSWTATTTIVYT